MIEVPIFYAVNDNYAPFLALSIKSLLNRSSQNYFYKIHVIDDNISEINKEKIKKLGTLNSSIIFTSLNQNLDFINDNKQNRLRPDIFTLTIYFRLFIPEMFKEYDKAIYIDCDTILNADISELYNIDLENNYIGACQDKSIIGIKEFEDYFTYGVGIDYKKYINSGVLLLNMKELRNKKINEKFLYLFNKYHFENVDPDQAYINFLCHGNIKYLDEKWNAMPGINKIDNPKLIHYNLFYKPWHYDNIEYEEYFWETAQQTEYYDEIKKIKDNFGLKDKEKDENNLKDMRKRAYEISKSNNNFRALYEAGEITRL